MSRGRSEFSNVKAVKCGELIDGTGREPIRHAIVVVRDSEIVDVGKADEVRIPTGAEVIDASEKTVMPGLMDMHVHLCYWGKERDWTRYELDTPPTLMALKAARAAKETLEAGFTTVRDAGAYNDCVISTRKAVELGIIPGPRILTAGVWITQTGGPCDTDWPSHLPSQVFHNATADGVEGVRKAVRERFRAGSDFIKIFTTGDVYSRGTGPDVRRFTIEEIRTIVDEAHAVRRKVAAHAEGVEGIKNAARAGVDTIEHGIYLDDEACQIMKQNNIILVPTLVVLRNIVAEGIEAGMLPEAVRKGKEAGDAHFAGFRRAHEAGVKVATGSDAFMGICRHGENARELEMMVEAGLTPMEAIIASTKTGAEALGLEDQIGTLEVGKTADMVIVDGNPLRDITILQDQKKIGVVMKGGHLAVIRD